MTEWYRDGQNLWHIVATRWTNDEEVVTHCGRLFFPDPPTLSQHVFDHGPSVQGRKECVPCLRISGLPVSGQQNNEQS